MIITIKADQSNTLKSKGSVVVCECMNGDM